VARTVRSGVVEATITGDIDDIVDQIGGGAAGVVRRQFRATHEKIYADALALWPERSGRSKAGLRVRERITADAIESVIDNVETYAYKIRFSQYTADELTRRATTARQREWIRRKLGRGAPSAKYTMRPVWSTLIRTPHNREAKRLAQNIERDVQRLADGS